MAGAVVVAMETEVVETAMAVADEVAEAAGEEEAKAEDVVGAVEEVARVGGVGKTANSKKPINTIHYQQQARPKDQRNGHMQSIVVAKEN